MTEVTGMEVALPHTGELITLEDIVNAEWVVPYDQPVACAITLDQIFRIEMMFRELKSDLRSALQFESEKQGSKTLHLPGGLKVEIKTSNVVDWDYDKLEELLDAGLPDDRYNALVVETVSRKVSAREADRISAANPEYARIIKAARRPLEAKHAVSVVRS